MQALYRGVSALFMFYIYHPKAVCTFIDKQAIVGPRPTLGNLDHLMLH